MNKNIDPFEWLRQQLVYLQEQDKTNKKAIMQLRKQLIEVNRIASRAQEQSRRLTETLRVEQTKVKILSEQLQQVRYNNDGR